ncbi:unnamed protein product [Meganyctiphanes norvegica]|uniref:Uncharacterized protein n=1 Tax=Meganyctiphanes norvegica TaxID=48144 RepID=A0AAV2PWA0_MEGNR
MLGLRGRTTAAPATQLGELQPTLPPEVAMDAALYVGVIMVFYVAIIVILVGTNIHRIRCPADVTQRRVRLVNVEEFTPLIDEPSVHVSTTISTTIYDNGQSSLTLPFKHDPDPTVSISSPVQV